MYYLFTFSCLELFIEVSYIMVMYSPKTLKYQSPVDNIFCQKLGRSHL